MHYQWLTVFCTFLPEFRLRSVYSGQWRSSSTLPESLWTHGLTPFVNSCVFLVLLNESQNRTIL
jgi:hypothetical protein